MMMPTDENALPLTTTGNRLMHVQGEQQEVIVKHYRTKPLTPKLIKYRMFKLLGKPIPVEYRTPQERRLFEQECLTLWLSRGYRVPSLRPIPKHYSAREPILAIEFIAGERLDHFLEAAGKTIEEKLEVVRHILSEMGQRHCRAIFEAEHRLIHYDANLRNLIVRNKEIFHLDFEMGHLREEIDRSAAREVLKLSLQTTNCLGRAHLDALADLLIHEYGIVHILKRVVREVLKGRFQGYHLHRDRKRKERDPNLLTKVDVAQAIEAALARKARPQTSQPVGGSLQQALETSWNGKFYQSLDDSDTRGRDMRHRYQTMQLPESFEGLSVLDIGCNIGRICLDLKKHGARRAVGIDHRADVIDAMKPVYAGMGIDIELYAFDINRGLSELRDQIGEAPFDYVFALSIWSHVDQHKLWEIIDHFSAHVLIFEDNAPSRIKSLEKIREILESHLHFKTIEFLGFTRDRGVRAVFRLTK